MNPDNSKSTETKESTDPTSVQEVSPAIAFQRTLEIFETMGLIRPTADLIFRRLMNHYPEALMDLLSRILEPAQSFVELEFLDPKDVDDSDCERAIRLSLLQADSCRRVVKIEIQSSTAIKIERRAVFDLLRLTYQSLQTGSCHEPLPECISIYFIEGAYFPANKPAHQVYKFMDTLNEDPERSWQILHPSAPKIHFIELGKLASSNARNNPLPQNWINFLLPQSVADWEKVADEVPMFAELRKLLEHFSAEDKLARQQRAIDEARWHFG